MNGQVSVSGPPTIQWRDYYSVGDCELDGQHQKVIYMINWLYEVIWFGDDRAALPTLMRRLSEYTDSHFGDEERVMRKVDFPGYAQHKEIHDKLSGDTRDLLFGSLQEDGPDTRDVLQFLKRWWINHITGDDKEYMYYLVERNRDASVPTGVDSEVRELLGALIENEQRLRHYYEVLADFVPAHRVLWESLQDQEESHVTVLREILQRVKESPARFAAGKLTASAARMMMHDVNNMIEKIERRDVHPNYAIRFAADLEHSLLESHLDQAIKTDVVGVQNMLARLSQESASHRGLLCGILD